MNARYAMNFLNSFKNSFMGFFYCSIIHSGFRLFLLFLGPSTAIFGEKFVSVLGEKFENLVTCFYAHVHFDLFGFYILRLCFLVSIFYFRFLFLYLEIKCGLRN